LVALGVALFLACKNNDDEEDDDQFREDVIWCEDAVAHLAACCPGFDPTKIACRYYFSHTSGCGTETTTSTEPAFTEDESKCLQHTSCHDLVTNGVCERAADAGAARTTTTTVSTNDGAAGTNVVPPSRDAVCP